MPQCGDIFYTLEPARRVTPRAMSPLVQIAPSSFHCFYTSASISNPVRTKTKTPTANFSAAPANQTTTAKSLQTSPHTERPHTFPPPEPTSQSQWSSRSTEYTRRSRTCRPAATGSCRNSAGRAWASSRSGSLRTLYCKWGCCLLEVFRKKGNGVGGFCLAFPGDNC